MPITRQQHRYHLGRFILISSGLLVILIFIFKFMGGFTDEEFQRVTTLIFPIKAVYVSALIKYIISNPTEQEQEGDQEVLGKLYVSTSRLIIITHMLSLLILVTLFALFNLTTFENFIVLISRIETLFGIYVGLFLTDLFQVKENSNINKDEETEEHLVSD